MASLLGENKAISDSSLGKDELPDNSSIYIGVDVGTGSVRAALFTEKGEYLKSTTIGIAVNNPLPDVYQQSSVEIWSAVCGCVTESIQSINYQHNQPVKICGIGFAATCSLVVIGPNNKGLR